MNNETTRFLDECENEYKSVYDEFLNQSSKDYVSYIDTSIEKQKIKHRLTVLRLGIYAIPKEKKNIASTVDDWLMNAGFEALSYRNRIDAVFMYTYATIEKSFSDSLDEEKLNVLLCNIDKYNKWTKNRTIESLRVKKKNIEARKKGESIESKFGITTFGDLHQTLTLTSNVSENQTMQNKEETEQRVINILPDFIDSGKTVIDFLEHLENDLYISAYTWKATYCVRQILFSIFKQPLDWLCEHNLPEDEIRKNNYQAARQEALSSDVSFNRYLNYNRLLLKDVKNSSESFREWLLKEKRDTSTCMQKIAESEISYGRLFTNIFDFFMMCSYTISKEYNHSPSDLNISREQYEMIFGRGQDCRTRMRTILKGLISGDFYVDRTFLAVFAFYAGYSTERIDNFLSNSGYEVLNEKNTIDKIIMEFSNSGFVQKMFDFINKKGFIKYMKEDAITGKYLWEKEHIDYDNHANVFQERFAEALCAADSEVLTSMFAKVTNKDITKKAENELKQMVQRR